MTKKRIPIPAFVTGLIALALPACQPHEEAPHQEEHHRIVATSPRVQDVTVTQQYVCLIHSQRHIKVCALENGYLEAIPVKEGQAVKAGDVLFKVMPTLYKARLEAEQAEVQLAQLEYNNTDRLVKDKVVSPNELALQQAKLAKAQAKAKLAEAELNFTTITASFDGIVDRLHEQQGSLVKEGEVLTTLSDNSVMWVYFNVPEVQYLQYKGRLGKSKSSSQIELADARIELVLADGSRFPHSAGNTVTVESEFNKETGNIPFRADVPNPDRLLRHGQTGNVLIHRTLRGAVVIPQRATFETLDKLYAFVIGDDHVVRQREVAVQHEMEDVFVLKGGLRATDRIVLDGVRQVRDGEKVEYEFRKPEDVAADLKKHAE